MLSRLAIPFQRSVFHRWISSMEALVQQSIKLVESKKKSTVPWKLDEIYNQPCYVYNGSDWEQKELVHEPVVSNIQKLALFSWNIDFMLPFPDSRMKAAVDHLESVVSKETSETVASVIFLAECLESDLKVIASHPWVRERFSITDLDGKYWQSGHYGTTTLIDRRLPILSCFRVHYTLTRMERDGLFVDVQLGEAQKKPIRLCNTHLESLALEPPYRPPQMKACAKYMHDSSVYGAVLAGDLNAIQEFDKHLHSDNDLKDAYLELGGKEDDAEGGHTWGQQAATVQMMRFGTSRMDKVFYCGGLRCEKFERFGAGVMVEDQAERDEIVKLGFHSPWITDHLGVKALFALE